MLAFQEKKYVAHIPTGASVLVVGDVGGTNCNFGIFVQQENEDLLLVSIHFKSQEIIDFVQVLIQLLSYIKETYTFTPSAICLAAAGVVSAHRDYCKPTNLSFSIDAQDIIKKTTIASVIIVNDFEVISYGLSRIAPADIVLVNAGRVQEGTNKAIVGAGTGLGKCIMFWESDRKIYVPVASEGGHADFAAQSELEYDFVTFLKQCRNKTCAISWEDVLSGKGMRQMYTFFLARNRQAKKNQAHEVMPDDIFKSRHVDEYAWNTFELYAKIYGRCVKNFALDALARGGMYIAGGIAAHNVDLFRQEIFLHEFINCGKQQELLKSIPIYVIGDYNVSLYGAAEYVRLEHDKK